ncbi:MAG: hypothetical protein IPH81_20070 [Candidatus Microthrix sp.]|nr:hypothetical protein [Candidatus Microthrix sp.]
MTSRRPGNIAALTNKSRTAIYSGLTDIIDEDAVEEMLTNFQPEKPTNPSLGDFLAAQMSQLRAEMSQMEGRIISTMDAQLTSLTRWTVGMIITVPAATVALQAFVS